MTITEKRGEHADKDAPTLKETGSANPIKNGTTVTTQCYTASLTGDIWLKVTHKYSVDEAKARIPPTTGAEIRQPY